MRIVLIGTVAEIDTAIAKIGTLLTVYECSTPLAVGGGRFEVRIGVQF